MRAGQIPPMTIAIARDDKTVYSRAFGMADLENSVPATIDTLIWTASIARPITAVVAMTLVEAGRLDLDATVQTYCPPFPAKPWPIPTRELLAHTSGIRHYRTAELLEDNTHHYQWLADGFAMFAGTRCCFSRAPRSDTVHTAIPSDASSREPRVLDSRITSPRTY